GGPPAIGVTKVNRLRIAGRWQSWAGADLLDVIRPGNGKGLWAPNFLKQIAIGPLRCPVNRTGNVRQTHLDRVGWRPFRLFGRRVAETPAGRAHIPEVSTDQIVLAWIVVQYRCERRIRMRLRFAFAVARAH